MTARPQRATSRAVIDRPYNRSGASVGNDHQGRALIFMWLIVGLGNPGEEYADTYHNVGFRVLLRIAEQQNVRIKERCGPAIVSGKVLLGGQSAVLVMPQTYMNNSGSALPPVFERFESTAGDLIVVYDDIALPLGKLRVRQKGSAGG